MAVTRNASTGAIAAGVTFYSCPLGRDHLLTALAYVDLNPLRAGLLRLPE